MTLDKLLLGVRAQGPPDVREARAPWSNRPDAGSGWASAFVCPEGVPWALPRLALASPHYPFRKWVSDHVGAGTGHTDWVPAPFCRRGTVGLRL